MSQIPWEKHILVGSQCFFLNGQGHLCYFMIQLVIFTHVYTASLTVAMQVFITLDSHNSDVNHSKLTRLSPFDVFLHIVCLL